MIRNNKYYAKKVLEELRKKDPDLYNYISEIQIYKVLMFFTRNILTCMEENISISSKFLFNIHPNPTKLAKRKMKYDMWVRKRKEKGLSY